MWPSTVFNVYSLFSIAEEIINQIKVDPRSYERYFVQLRKEAWKKKKNSGLHFVIQLVRVYSDNAWRTPEPGKNTSHAPLCFHHVLMSSVRYPQSTHALTNGIICFITVQISRLCVPTFLVPRYKVHVMQGNSGYCVRTTHKLVLKLFHVTDFPLIAF